MKAQVVDARHKLILTDLPEPKPKDHEVIVNVHAMSINPVDLKTLTGAFGGLNEALNNEKTKILGSDIAGEITAVGRDVKKFKVGDKVFGVINFPGIGKAFAEFVAAPEAHLAKIPITWRLLAQR